MLSQAQPFRIAIVGVGGVGYRHLESCSFLIPHLYEIHIIDKNSNTLKAAMELQKDNSFIQHTDLGSLPKTIDLGIIATQANQRANVTESLVSCSNVKSLVLEKVLFQKADDYTRIEQLLERNKIKAWVNCPRRMWPVYKEIKSIVQKTDIASIEIGGTDWDFGCNSIHFLDLISYIVNSHQCVILNSKFPVPPQPAKREGNYFVSGEVEGTFDGKCYFKISSLEGETDHKKMIITTNSSILIHVLECQTQTTYNVYEKEKLETSTTFPNLYQSQLTKDVVEEIMSTKGCLLPTYKESQGLHLSLIKAILAHTRQFFPNLDFCPIT